MAKVSDPKKEAWARHLRTADELSKKKKFEEAILELEQALKIDPKDMYARSFLGRLRAQWDKKQEEVKAAIDGTESSLEKRMELIPKFLAAADRFVAEQNYRAALQEISKVYKLDPTNYYAQAYSDRIDELMRAQDDKKKQKTEVMAPAVETPVAPQDSGDAIFYRELLKEYWFDGKLTPEELEHLSTVQQAFGITAEMHERLSKEVKFEAYVDALRIAWIDGVVSETERRTLEFMRNKYAISPEENARAEGMVQRLRKENPTRPKLLVVDSDKEHALTITKFLKRHGYDTMLAPRPEEALKILDAAPPVAIIMELQYEGSEMNGFELYRRARMFPSLVRIPIFLTVRIKDKDVLYAAVRLGIDHVLRKPVDPDFIVAALAGRKAREELILL